jgi:hypothetical protein
MTIAIHKGQRGRLLPMTDENRVTITWAGEKDAPMAA